MYTLYISYLHIWDACLHGVWLLSLFLLWIALAPFTLPLRCEENNAGPGRHSTWKCFGEVECSVLITFGMRGNFLTVPSLNTISVSSLQRYPAIKRKKQEKDRNWFNTLPCNRTGRRGKKGALIPFLPISYSACPCDRSSAILGKPIPLSGVGIKHFRIGGVFPM